ncbi:MAG: hypothetical protein D8M58_06920 [Calditrichaeota bacterium]|nr:MAG: hypothetical protein DWQ03_19580 [Calditrichota bacterium]MBL1205111.1 hypothetical protein [Calditrichota bacterium]NOG44941.1 hypothetical protein [Calditrichota bacterium]
MKLILSIAFLLLINQFIFAQGLFAPKGRSSLSLAASFPDNPDYKISSFDLSLKTQERFIFSILNSSINPNNDSELSFRTIGASIGFIKYPDSKTSKTKIIIIPSATYVSSLKKNELTTFGLSISFLREFRNEKFVFIPNLNAGYQISSIKDNSSATPFWGIGLETGVILKEKVVFGGHISLITSYNDKNTESAASFGFSFSVFLPDENIKQ